MLQERIRQVDEDQAAEATAETGSDPAVIAAGASVMLSLYYYFVRGDRRMGMFVGLWPPTILAFASYFTQTRMSEKLESSFGLGPIEQLFR